MKLEDKIKYLKDYFNVKSMHGSVVFDETMLAEKIITAAEFLKLKLLKRANWNCYGQKKVEGPETSKGILYYELCYKIVKQYDINGEKRGS